MLYQIVLLCSIIYTTGHRHISKSSQLHANRCIISMKSDTITSQSYETKLRTAIRRRDWREAEVISLNWDINHNISRTPLFVIVETCRRTGSVDAILPLIEYLNTDHFYYSSEADIMPFLADKTNNNLQTMLDIVQRLNYKGLKYTAKPFSMLLKSIQSSQDIACILSLAVKCAIVPDIIFVNGLIDAYIR